MVDRSDMKLGRLPNDPSKPRLRLAPLLTGVTPEHPPAGDYLNRVEEWELGANDRYGTCGPTSVANYRKLVATLPGANRTPIMLNDIFDLYRRSGNPNFNPSTGADDNGVIMQNMLNQVVKGGIAGIKALAFAQVDHTNPEEVEAAISLFGGVLYGVTLDVAQQSQRVWDFVPNNRVWGGHAIYVGAWNTAGTTREACVTWAEVVAMTQAFENNQLDEAWVVIWPEHLSSAQFQMGVDVARLAADYEQLTGRPFPVEPTPAPPGPPQPAPAPTDSTDQKLAAALRRVIDNKSCPHYLRRAAKAWLEEHR